MEWEGIWQAILDSLEAKGLRVALIIIVAIVLLLVVRLASGRLVAVYKNRHHDRELQKRAATLGAMLRYALSIAVLCVAAMLLLDLLGLKLGPMLATAGVIGIAIGFGAQHLVQDVTNGFFIMMDNEIRVGDVVEAAGKRGTVERVGLRQTVLRSIDGNVHYIPNSKIDVVTNMTKVFSYCMLSVGVAYREDVDEVIEVLKSVEETMRADDPYSEWILEPIEVLGLDEFADSAMIIKARIKVQPIRQWRVKREFNHRLKKAFDTKNIEIPFPHVTMYMGQDKKGDSPPLRVSRQEGTGLFREGRP
jgi:small conductance mechanosensitive channel